MKVTEIDVLNSIEKYARFIAIQIPKYLEDDGSLHIPAEDVPPLYAEILNGITYFDYLKVFNTAEEINMLNEARSSIQDLLASFTKHTHKNGDVVIPKREVSIITKRVYNGLKKVKKNLLLLKR